MLSQPTITCSNKFKSNEHKLDFKDVLIVPKHTNINSRKEPKLNRTFTFLHSNKTWTGVPISVSNMDTTGTIEMAHVMSRYNCLTCLDKHIDFIPNNLNRNNYALTIGTDFEDRCNLCKHIDNIEFICIDVANGYTDMFLECIKNTRLQFPNKTIIAGNVATPEACVDVINNGADIVKIGIGSGSVCTTRLQTGIGYPQLSCILECSQSVHELGAHVMSDGGIQVVGDFSKAFGAGADFVMAGGMFSGHDECSGNEIIGKDNNTYKEFYGMSSEHAMNKLGINKSYRSYEGKKVLIKSKGSVHKTVRNIFGGIRSTMTYINAKHMEEINENTSFIKVYNQNNTIYENK